MHEESLKVERREFPRYRASLPVRFRFLDSRYPTTYEATTEDVSLGGLFINKILEKERLGKRLNLEMDLPNTYPPLKPSAGVVWIRRDLPDGRIEGVGIKFTEIVPEEKIKLNNYLSWFTLPHLPAKVKSIRPPDIKLNDKEKRSLEILDTLRKKDPISKAQIAKEVDLNIVTVSNYIEEFKRKGIIFERGLDESSGGRRPTLLEINPNYGFIIGAEFNFLDNYISVVLTDFILHNLAHKKVQMKEDLDSLDEIISELINTLIEDLKIDRNRILGIGAGLTAPKDNHVNLRDLLERKIDKMGLPLLIENSTIANIFAEKWTNLDLYDKESILYIGLNGSVSMMLRGDIYRGSNRGELKMDLNTARDIRQNDTECWLENNCLLREETASINLSNAAQLGRRFGVRIAYLINILDPEIVVIEKIPQEVQIIFFDALRDTIKRWMLVNHVPKTLKIIPSQLKENSLALGMAALVCRDLYTQV